MSMKLEVGKLYICEKFHLMFYPDQETAAASGDGGCSRRHGARSTAAYWSNLLGKPVSYREKNIPLLILNDKEEYVEVLIEDKKGWIIYKDWLNIKEIV